MLGDKPGCSPEVVQYPAIAYIEDSDGLPPWKLYRSVVKVIVEVQAISSVRPYAAPSGRAQGAGSVSIREVTPAEYCSTPYSVSPAAKVAEV